MITNMKRIIKFGERFAGLAAGEHRAMLTVTVDELPVGLADELNSMSDLRVIEVFRDDNGTPCIRLSHDLAPCDLVNSIGEAITAFYNTDITIYHATAPHIV